MRDFFDRLPGGSRTGFAAGLALLLIAVLAVALTAGDDDPAAETSSTVAATAPAAHTPITPRAASDPAGKATKRHSPKPGKPPEAKPEKSTGTGSKPPKAAPDPAPAPPAPGSKPGTPVGQTPPGATPATNAQIVNSVIREYLTSIYSGAGAQACAQLSEQGLAAMEKKIRQAAPETDGSPCAQSILLYAGAYGKAIRDPKITKLTVNGDTATAVGPYREPAKLSQHGDVWLIDDYGS